jgi:2-amino-4-hydroxy-6-hydroxymethyldihydropteridine diphosphokinase
VTDQPEFRNAVAAIDAFGPSDPDAAAIALLTDLKSVEREAGRREGHRWGPRELDLDLLVFGRHQILVERPPEARSLDVDHDRRTTARLLEVPHRDLGARLFVLAPLVDLVPRLVPPGWS